jgi:hypothetical protein
MSELWMTDDLLFKAKVLEMLLVLHGPMVLFFTLPPVRRVVMDKVQLRLLTKMRKRHDFKGKHN